MNMHQRLFRSTRNTNSVHRVTGLAGARPARPNSSIGSEPGRSSPQALAFANWLRISVPGVSRALPRTGKPALRKSERAPRPVSSRWRCWIVVALLAGSAEASRAQFWLPNYITNNAGFEAKHLAAGG